MTDATTAAQSPNLTGAWNKITTDACADKYPAAITFAASTFRGTRGATQGMIWWDAGIYRLEGPRTLLLSVATDELVRYDLTTRGDEFDVTDAEGCHVTYRRASDR